MSKIIYTKEGRTLYDVQLIFDLCITERLTGNQITLLLWLIHFVENRNQHSIQNLATVTNTNPSTVKSNLNVLESKGWIQREIPANDTNRTTIYHAGPKMEAAAKEV